MPGFLDRFRKNHPAPRDQAADPQAPSAEPDPDPAPSIDAMRRSYQAGQLIEQDTPADDPFALFREWFSQATETARQHRWAEANAVTLATADAQGQPAARVVLLKGLDHGLVFYSNHQSTKGQHLAQNPVACLNFYWPWLERQCRFAGPVARLPRDTSEAYFRSRPRGSQLGAIASDQSREVADRDTLDRKLDALEAAHPKDDAANPIPFPDDWGGYRLTPLEVEFWQGRDNRMHDRLVYRRPTVDTPTFTRTRLQP